MEIMDVIRQRHSVRQYDERPIEEGARKELEAMVKRLNGEAGLNMQLIVDEPVAFSSGLAHYGKFSGVRNYFALVGPKGADLDEKLGYYGEQLVLKAQELGLNTCWVGLTFKKNKEVIKVAKGEKLSAVISVGYGVNRGVPHKIKSRDEVAAVANGGEAPEWFWNGVDAALLAPTAMNQQKFKFTLEGDRVEARAGVGFFAKMDLGIVKYHFEAAAGREHFSWK